VNYRQPIFFKRDKDWA